MFSIEVLLWQFKITHLKKLGVASNLQLNTSGSLDAWLMYIFLMYEGQNSMPKAFLAYYWDSVKNLRLTDFMIQLRRRL
jgi:hypothetical protein